MLPNAFLPFIFALAASILPSGLAHGFLASVTIDGKLYKGNIPNAKSNASPIRQIDSVNPIMPSKSNDMSCGANAKPAEMVVNAKPGSQLAFDWHSGENTDWPHNTGPMLTYMASCGNVTCDKFDATTAKWFKVQEDGRVDGDNSAEWLQARLFRGQSANATIPDHIPPGQYLIRHELIGLHNAVTRGLAEFYPSCTQIRIDTNNNAVIQPAETVAFPGAYSDDDPGIHIDVFGPPISYPFPGPNISNIVTGDERPASNGTSKSSPEAPTGTGNGQNSPSSNPGSSKNCLRPRKVSRVMARYLRKEMAGPHTTH